jgi:hypothetical protein
VPQVKIVHLSAVEVVEIVMLSAVTEAKIGYLSAVAIIFQAMIPD